MSKIEMPHRNTYFSVVIPLFNKYDFIKTTVNSVLKQTYPYFEIIVVDDGSTDGSAEIIKKIKDERIRLISQTNAGVSAARNKGIEEAKYELIAFLDADDWWNENYLSSMQKLIEQYPAIFLYGTRYAEVINGKNTTSSRFFKHEGNFVVFDLIKVGGKNKNAALPIHTSSTIVRKSVISGLGGFDTRIKFFEDYDFFIRIGLHSKVAYLNGNPLSFYSKDVPKDQRATGKLPALKTHWVSHLDKFSQLENSNRNLKRYLDKFKLFTLIQYKNTRKFRQEMKKIKSTVSLRNYTWKFLIIYYSPSYVTKGLLKLYSKLKWLIPSRYI